MNCTSSDLSVHASCTGQTAVSLPAPRCAHVSRLWLWLKLCHIAAGQLHASAICMGGDLQNVTNSARDCSTCARSISDQVLDWMLTLLCKCRSFAMV